MLEFTAAPRHDSHHNERDLGLSFAFSSGCIDGSSKGFVELDRRILKGVVRLNLRLRSEEHVSGGT